MGGERERVKHAAVGVDDGFLLFVGEKVEIKDPEIKKLFEDNKKVDEKKNTQTKRKHEIKFNSIIHRFVSEIDFKKQIPERYREKFIKYISGLKEENYDYNNVEFPLNELGDDIVKGLYLWNESDNKKESYSNFRSKHEQCMDKNLIIAKIKGMENISDNTGGFGDWIENI